MDKSQVKLSDLIDGIELQNNRIDAFLNSKTGQVVYVENNLYKIVKSEYDLNDYPQKQQKKIKLTEKIMNEDYFIAVPSKKDISEYTIMKAFIYLINNEEVKEKLLESIQSKKPYKRFNNEIIELDIKDKWLEFKENYIKEKLIKWGKYNNFEIVE